MTQRQSFGTLIAYVVLILSAVIAGTILCALGKIDAAAVMTVLGGTITGAAVLVHSTATAAINGGPKPSLDRLAESNPELAARMMTRQTTVASASHTAEMEQK